MFDSLDAIRRFQIILTLIYGELVSIGIYEYLIQGIIGLILRIRPKYDSILLIVLSSLMFIFVIYGIFAVWFCRTRMSLVSMLVLFVVFCLTLAQTIIELRNMGLRPTRVEWIIVRTTELVTRLCAVFINASFIHHLRKLKRFANER